MPATSADWQPTIRMTVFKRGQDWEVCEVLADGTHGLLKVKDAAEKDSLGKVFGVPHFRFTKSERYEDGTLGDAGRTFGAWEKENLWNIAHYELRFGLYYVGQYIADGVEDMELRQQGKEESSIAAALEALRRAKQDASKGDESKPEDA